MCSYYCSLFTGHETGKCLVTVGVPCSEHYTNDVGICEVANKSYFMYIHRYIPQPSYYIRIKLFEITQNCAMVFTLMVSCIFSIVLSTTVLPCTSPALLTNNVTSPTSSTTSLAYRKCIFYYILNEVIKQNSYRMTCTKVYLRTSFDVFMIAATQFSHA